jgi:hypothetical protein
MTSSMVTAAKLEQLARMAVTSSATTATNGSAESPYHEPVPLIRGDLRFLGWAPVDQAEQLNAPMRKERRRRRAPKTVRVDR